jgi:glycosyltransferase involved in cell wall biosynthesis
MEKGMTSERQQGFRVVALVTVRNEELYVDRCIRHLVLQGVDICIIDNDSTDRTPEIAQSFLGKGVIAVKRYPYPGFFDLRGILRNEENLSYEIDADWFMHHDADEIREAPRKDCSLKEALLDVDRKGFNAVNFKEFVFVPTDEMESFENRDYVKDMRYYYFFQNPNPRTNAWKRRKPVNLVTSGGHSVTFENRKVFEQYFIMRHYLTLSRNHLIAKYAKRVFSPEELRDGWHGKRATLTPDEIRFPDKKELQCYKEDGRWDDTIPWKRHFFAKK